MIIVIGLLACLLSMLLSSPDDTKYEQISGVKKYYTYNGEIYFKKYHNSHTNPHSYIKVNNVDLASFELMPPIQFEDRIYEYAAKDKNQIYYNEKTIKGIDYQTAEYLRDGYFRDKNHVYYIDQIVEKANPETFKSFGDIPRSSHGVAFGYDGKHYFYKNKMVKSDDGTPPDKINLLMLSNGPYISNELFWSGNNIYYFDTDSLILKKIGERDNVTSLKVIDNGVFADSFHVYYIVKHHYIKNYYRRGNTINYDLGWGRSFTELNAIKPDSFMKKGDTVILRKDLPTRDSEYYWSYGSKKETIRGVLYQSGDKTYFHPEYEDGEYSLYGLNNNQLELLPDGDITYSSSWGKTQMDYPVLLSLRHYLAPYFWMLIVFIGGCIVLLMIVACRTKLKQSRTRKP